MQKFLKPNVIIIIIIIIIMMMMMMMMMMMIIIIIIIKVWLKNMALNIASSTSRGLKKVSENDKVKLFCDFNVFTDRVIEARRPDIMVLNKETKECLIVDIAVPGDTRVNSKEDEVWYRELCRELGRLWGVKCRVDL